MRLRQHRCRTSSRYYHFSLIFIQSTGWRKQRCEVKWRVRRGPRASIALCVLLLEKKDCEDCDAGIIITRIHQWSLAASIANPSDFAVDGASGWFCLDHDRRILSGDDARSQNPFWTARIRHPVAKGWHSIDDYAIATDRHHALRRRVTVTKWRRRESSRFRQHRTRATHEVEASRVAARHSSSPGRSKLPLEAHGDACGLRLRANPPRQFLTRLVKRLFLRALNRRLLCLIDMYRVPREGS